MEFRALLKTINSNIQSAKRWHWLFPLAYGGFWIKVVMAFVFSDLAFVALPLGILWAIKSNTSGISWDQFVISADFAFALVAVLMLGLTNFIELKTRIQEDLSEKLIYGTRYISILLVLACVLLATILLRQNNLIQVVLPDTFIQSMSNFLLAIGLILLFSRHFDEQRIEYRRILGVFPDRKTAMDEIYFSLRESLEQGNTALFLSQKIASLPDISSGFTDQRNLSTVSQQKAELIQMLAEQQTLLRQVQSEIQKAI